MSLPVGRYAGITRICSAELDVVTLSRHSCTKFYVTAHPISDGDPYSMFENLGRFVRERKATIVAQDVFGSCVLHADGMSALAQACGEVRWPVTWIEGYGRSAVSLTGTQVYALAGAEVEPVVLDGRTVGGTFEDDAVEYCILGDLWPPDTARSRTDQARATFEMIEAALGTVGMDLSNVVRTWLYIDEILAWYDAFNEVRTAFFDERGVFEGVVPASTGIGVANPAGAALVAEAFAVKAKHGSVDVHAVPSPLQCPATDYRSSFSRAVEVVLSDHRRLYVSGTASIGPDGNTVYVGDVERQIERTMDVVEAILESRGFDWTDTSRAIAYFKDMKDAPMLDEFCEAHALPYIPIAVAHGDICRDELLFEIEVDCVKELAAE